MYVIVAVAVVVISLVVRLIQLPTILDTSSFNYGAPLDDGW